MLDQGNIWGHQCCRNSRSEVSCKKGALKISPNSQENACARVSLLIQLQAKAFNVAKKETLAQVLSCKFGEIFKNIFFKRIPAVAVSDVEISD